MKTSRFATLSRAFTLVALLAIPGLAAAQPGYGCGDFTDMSNEQMLEMRQIRQSHWEKTQPIMQQRFAKLAELEHLFAANVKQDDPRLQAVRDELRAIDARLYAADADMLRQMGEKGLPYHGRMRGHMHGWRGGCPGMGYGREGGWHGMRGGYGPCGAQDMPRHGYWPTRGCGM